MSLLARWGRLSPGMKILIAMAIGVGAGVALGERAVVLQPLGDLFIRLLLMVAIPLILFNLVAGTSGLSDAGALGRVGGRFALFVLVTNAAAVLLGLGAVALLRPGVGTSLRAGAPPEVAEVPGVAQLLLDLVPANVFAALAQGNVAQIVVFAVFMGVTSLLLPPATRELIRGGSDAVAVLLRRMIEVVMRFGPIGIGALAAAAVGRFGPEVFGPLSLFIAAVTLGHAAMVALYLVLVAALAPDSPAAFLRRTGPLYATAVATCSSLASLGVAYQVAEERLRLPREVYAFTLPLGVQINKTGTCVMLGALLLFTAQAAGVPFPAAQIPSAVLLGFMLSAGTGGIPGGGLVVALIYVQAFGLPLEVAALVAGIYRLVDMGNTALNVGGDLVGSLIVTRLEERDVARGLAAEAVAPR